MSREILVVDDDARLAATLSDELSKLGFSVRRAYDGFSGIEEVRRQRPDLVLMDVRMDVMNGIDACRKLRETDKSLPIVFLTNDAQEEVEIRALAAGGDQYIRKGISDELLVARIEAVLRSREQAESTIPVFSFGLWTVDPQALELRTSRGRAVGISEQELYLLRSFATHPGELFTRESLVAKLWGPLTDVSDNALSVLVHRLKQKLGKQGDGIRMHRGSGYSYRP